MTIADQIWPGRDNQASLLRIYRWGVILIHIQLFCAVVVHAAYLAGHAIDPLWWGWAIAIPGAVFGAAAVVNHVGYTRRSMLIFGTFVALSFADAVSSIAFGAPRWSSVIYLALYVVGLRALWLLDGRRALA